MYHTFFMPKFTFLYFCDNIKIYKNVKNKGVLYIMDFGLTIYKCIHEWDSPYHYSFEINNERICLICGRYEIKMKDGKWVEIEEDDILIIKIVIEISGDRK